MTTPGGFGVPPQPSAASTPVVQAPASPGGSFLAPPHAGSQALSVGPPPSGRPQAIAGAAPRRGTPRPRWAWLAVVPVVVTGLIGAGTAQRVGQHLPPPPSDAQTTRVLPQVVPLVTGEYAFIAKHPDGSPVVPDPCRPMHWALNPEHMPAGADTQVREAFQFLSKATGLKFVEDAPTTEAPSETRQRVQPDRYGDRVVPVLVAFDQADQFSALKGDVAAVTLPDMASTDGPATERIITGQVIVDTDFISSVMSTGEGQSRFRMVLMHEFGHLVGLDHVDDSNEVMSPVADGFVYYGSGDQVGLAKAGSGSCFSDS